MSQPMEDRTITANEARATYVAKCEEIRLMETAKRYFKRLLTKVSQRGEPLVSFHTIGDTMYAVDGVLMLLELYSDADKMIREAAVVRDEAYAVWQSASADPHCG